MKQLRNENSVPHSYRCRTGITCSPGAAQQLFSVSGRHQTAYTASTASGVFVTRTANSRGRHHKVLHMAAEVASAIFILLYRDMVYIAEIRHCSTGPLVFKQCCPFWVWDSESMPCANNTSSISVRLQDILPLNTLIMALLLSLDCLSTEKDKIEILALLFWLHVSKQE